MKGKTDTQLKHFHLKKENMVSQANLFQTGCVVAAYPKLLSSPGKDGQLSSAAIWEWCLWQVRSITDHAAGCHPHVHLLGGPATGTVPPAGHRCMPKGGGMKGGIPNWTSALSAGPLGQSTARPPPSCLNKRRKDGCSQTRWLPEPCLRALDTPEDKLRAKMHLFSECAAKIF